MADYHNERLATLAMSAICMMRPTNLGGGGGIYGYMKTKSMPSLIAGVGFGLLYGYSHYLLGSGKAQLGLDWATVVSLVLAASMAPRAYKTQKPLPVTLAGLSGLVAIKMANEAYHLRHG